MNKTILSLALLGILALQSQAQVKSITLGIRTHCPYGIKGCWAEIKNGLEKPHDILSIKDVPDEKSSTCEVQMKSGWLPNPDMFAQNFSNMRIGVDVLGVEATAEGMLELQGTNAVLRLQGVDEVLHLAELTQKVQWDRKRNAPQKPSRAEMRAFRKLMGAHETTKLGKVRVTGPLLTKKPLNPDDDSTTILQVRQFIVLK